MDHYANLNNKDNIIYKRYLKNCLMNHKKDEMIKKQQKKLNILKRQLAVLESNKQQQKLNVLKNR